MRKNNMSGTVYKLENFEIVDRFIIFFLALVFFTSCSKSTGPTETITPQAASPSSKSFDYPTLIVDEDHQVQDSNKPPSYQISPVTGIRLDFAEFHFTYGTNAIIPNEILVVFPGSHTAYKLSSFTETNLYVIDRTTMYPVKGESFPGFRSGDRAMMIIGRTTSNTAEKEVFWGSWVGNIEVK